MRAQPQLHSIPKNRVIELTEDEYEYVQSKHTPGFFARWCRRIKSFFSLCFGLAFMGIMVMGVMEAYKLYGGNFSNAREDINTYIENLRSENKTLSGRLAQVEAVTKKYSDAEIQNFVEQIPPQFGVPPLIAETLVHIESGGSQFAMRHEDVWAPQAKKATSDKGEQYFYRHSIGVMQVGAWHIALTEAVKQKLGEKTWMDLLNPKVNIAVGSIVWRQAFDETRGTMRERLWGAFRRYNGSGARAEAYADKAMGKLTQLMADKQMEELAKTLKT